MNTPKAQLGYMVLSISCLRDLLREAKQKAKERDGKVSSSFALVYNVPILGDTNVVDGAVQIAMHRRDFSHEKAQVMVDELNKE